MPFFSFTLPESGLCLFCRSKLLYGFFQFRLSGGCAPSDWRSVAARYGVVPVRRDCHPDPSGALRQPEIRVPSFPPVGDASASSLPARGWPVRSVSCLDRLDFRVSITSLARFAANQCSHFLLDNAFNADVAASDGLGMSKDCPCPTHRTPNAASSMERPAARIDAKGFPTRVRLLHGFSCNLDTIASQACRCTPDERFREFILFSRMHETDGYRQRE